jgi:hypothetical protein
VANTPNISLSEEQKTWLNSRREAGGFARTTKLLERFPQLEGDGSNEAEPKEAILKIVKRVKKERRA